MGHDPADPGRQGRDRGRFGVNGHRRKFLALLGDSSVKRTWSRIGTDSVGSALRVFRARLAGQGRELVVVDTAEVDDDLVGDMTEILTLMCARLSGKRGAQNRAKRAVAAAAGVDDGEAA